MKKYLEFILIISLILKHINKLCKKASQKLQALARMSNFMSCQQKKTHHECFCFIAIQLLPPYLDVP